MEAKGLSVELRNVLGYSGELDAGFMKINSNAKET